jgi:hypothetical protein
MTACEIFGFMSSALSAEILETLHALDKEAYRAALVAIAEAKKVRPVFLERKPRVQRHADMVVQLGKPRLEAVASSLLRAWLVKSQNAMLVDFLNTLGVPHENGAVENLPPTIEDDKLKAAIEGLLAKYPHEKAAVYLLAFDQMNEAQWPLLKEMLEKDPRLQLCG